MKQKIENWLNKIEKEAQDLGINYFIMAAHGTKNAAVVSNNIQDNYEISKMQETYAKMHKPFKSITFRDFMDYIRCADKDECGMHFPFNDKEIAFHIYAGRNQVNICKKNCWGAYDSVYNFIFDSEAEMVNVYPVNNHYVDYNHPINININNSVTDRNNVTGYWETGIIRMDSYVAEIIRDSVGPYLAARNKEASN